MTSFNDGVLDVYRDKDIKTPFGAKVNARSVDDLEFVVRLAYKAQAIRGQDFTFAERHGMVLTMKVKTHLVPASTRSAGRSSGGTSTTSRTSTGRRTRCTCTWREVRHLEDETLTLIEAGAR